MYTAKVYRLYLFFQVEYSTDGILSLLSRSRVTGSHSSLAVGCTSNARFCVAALMVSPRHHYLGSGGPALELRLGCRCAAWLSEDWRNTIAGDSVVGIE